MVKNKNPTYINTFESNLLLILKNNNNNKIKLKRNSKSKHTLKNKTSSRRDTIFTKKKNRNSTLRITSIEDKHLVDFDKFWNEKFDNINTNYNQYNQIFMINKNNIFYKIFTNLCFIILVYSNIFISFNLVYYYKKHKNNIINSYIDYTIDIILFLEIIISFVPFKKSKRNFYFRKKDKNLTLYFLSWFLYDIMIIIPFNLFGFIKLYIFSRLIRIFKFLKYDDYFQKLFSYILNPGYDRLLNILILILLFFHSISLMFYFFGTFDSNNSWIISNNLMYESVYIKYINSFYWTNFTLFSVGYGDISAVNKTEYIFSIIIFLISILFNSMIISMTSNYLYDKFLYTKKHEKINWLFFRLKNGNRKLKKNLLNQLNSIFKVQYLKKSEYNELITSITFKLKDELNLQIKKFKLSNLYYFKSKSINFLNYINKHLEEENFFAKEYVFKEKTNANEIYFIYKGTISLNYKNKRLLKLKAGNILGEIDIFYYHNTKRTFNALCLEQCILFKLNKRDFEKIYLKKFINYGKSFLISIKWKKLKIELKTKILNIEIENIKPEIIESKLKIINYFSYLNLENSKNIIMNEQKVHEKIWESIDNIAFLSKRFKNIHLSNKKRVLKKKLTDIEKFRLCGNLKKDIEKYEIIL